MPSSCLTTHPNQLSWHDFEAAELNIRGLKRLKRHESLVRANKGRLALLISGLQDRLLVKSKVEQIVEHNRRAGYNVDIFMDVLGSGKQNSGQYSPVDGQINSQEAQDEQKIHGTLRGSRASFVSVVVRPEIEEIYSSFPADQEPFKGRMAQYSPFTSKVGRNVLRRFKAGERLMNLTMLTAAQGRFTYDYVLWTRDDDYWLGPFDLPPTTPEESFNVVFSKGSGCNAWGGINDKTLLYGWGAAQNLLGRYYSDFWDPDTSLNTYNMETFLSAFTAFKGMTSSPLAWEKLPTMDSVYIEVDGAPKLCQKSSYRCEGLPEGPPFEVPDYCA
jgi:hypothetical protein